VTRIKSLPWTRVAEITGLDRIGVPVFTAIRPESLGLSTTQGKGLTRERAHLGARMEATEHAAAEAAARHLPVFTTGDVRRRQGRFLDLGRCLRARAGIGLAPEDIHWVAGHDLWQGLCVHVPLELVTFDTTLPDARRTAYFRQTTDGLAAADCRDFAICHALLELIDRDALALASLSDPERRTARAVDPAAFRSEAMATLLHRLEAADVALKLFDITTDIGIPAYEALICDRIYADASQVPLRAISGGSGAHPVAEKAAVAAVLEAIQTRLTLISGARDDHPATDYARPAPRQLMAQMFAPAIRHPPEGFGHALPPASEHTADLLNWLRDRLNVARMSDVLVVDLPRVLAEVFAVRVIVPELLPPQEDEGARMGARGFVRMMGGW